VASFHQNAVALPSSVLAFVVFERLRRQLPHLDTFRLLRVLGPHAALSLEELRPDVEAVLAQLARLEIDGAIVRAPELRGMSAAALIEHGVATLSCYHRMPVLTLDGGRVRVGDPTLLLYYRNRLDGYGLSSATGRGVS
jgi:glycerol-3-phosphate O-acyltransferase